MKKLLFITILSFSVLFSYATDDPKDTLSIIQDVGNTVNNKTDYVDTSSTFRMIYSDIKSGLTGLAEGLKVGVEHVYGVLVKQQVVNAVVFLIILLASLTSLFVWFRALKSKEDWDETPLGVARVIQAVITIVLLIIGVCYIDVIVTGFINPEYGAIKEIMEFVRK